MKVLSEGRVFIMKFCTMKLFLRSYSTSRFTYINGYVDKSLIKATYEKKTYDIR